MHSVSFEPTENVGNAEPATYVEVEQLLAEAGRCRANTQDHVDLAGLGQGYHLRQRRRAVLAVGIERDDELGAGLLRRPESTIDRCIVTPVLRMTNHARARRTCGIARRVGRTIVDDDSVAVD